jgi:hypothetical protein
MTVVFRRQYLSPLNQDIDDPAATICRADATFQRTVGESLPGCGGFFDGAE